MGKKKSYIVSIKDQTITPYDEIYVDAKNKREARKKANKIINTHIEYMGWEITDILED